LSLANKDLLKALAIKDVQLFMNLAIKDVQLFMNLYYAAEVTNAAKCTGEKLDHDKD